ncbi:MAG: heme lyase CcmF/NrfE family subunit [Chloroflexi bacterium]|nr:heme lyase CcmF/NrfE family subunit [Chloroflexota bacterium]MBV9896474.1 heme lyase CcmF/NrfE family subunit [Chloroflexota bacterium]
MASLGQICIVGALGLALYAIIGSLAGVRVRSRELILSGRNAAWAVTGLITAASLTLLAALAFHDFSLRYVWEHSSRAMSLDLVLAAFYSGQQGSLLYWSWTLSIFSAIVLWQQRKPGPHRVFMPYVVAVLMAIEAFMTLLLGFVATPFEALPRPPQDGVGLNPLLYDAGMRIHPPMLLAGLMSWSVPFAFAIAALATGKLGNDWLSLSRRYAMVAWVILGLGNVLGAWWAYHVLGWGGYWGWDPVENVALMPWIVGTAFIHSIQMQERRGMLKAWNILLIMVTFFLSIFGTFVVRSGILASVHSFALSEIGPFFLTFLALVICGSLALFFWRLPQLRGDNQLDSLLSRESSFLINNLLFLGIAFAIFWGTIYPLVAEAVADQKVSVGPPYFKQVAGPLLGAVLLLMGIGPLMPWRRASREHLLHNFVLPVLGMIMGLIVIAVGGVRDPFALLGFGLCLFVLGTIVQEFARGAMARHRATGENYALALGSLVRRNNRRYGGYLVHLAILLIGAGAVGSQIYQQQTVATLAPGQTVALGAYTLTSSGVQTTQQPGVKVTEGLLTVNGTEQLRPERDVFDNFPQQPSTKVGLRSTPFEDLYVVLADWQGDGPGATVSLAVFVNPLVSWIWAGGVLLLLGTLVTLWPAPVPARQHVLARAPGALGAEA